MTELEERVAELEDQVARIHGALMIINATITALALKLRAEGAPH